MCPIIGTYTSTVISNAMGACTSDMVNALEKVGERCVSKARRGTQGAKVEVKLCSAPEAEEKYSTCIHLEIEDYKSKCPHSRTKTDGN